DTSMALCLAESLLEAGWDPADQARRYLRWYREGHLSSNGRCFDIGNTVRSALHSFERTGVPEGPADDYSAGNGSLMRLAPVPIRYARDEDQAVEKSGESSRVTHAAPAAVDACRYYGGLIVAALSGTGKDDLLSPDLPVTARHLPSLHPAVRPVAEGSFKLKSPPEIRGSGYVVESLEAALWAFHTTETFQAGALAAANLGQDADTTAAIYGQLAGAFYGAQGIPEAWSEVLARRDLIEALALRLAAAARAGSPPARAGGVSGPARPA
ncbi:MAG TPA: ADP-ribosylglycohydrolase family protein, partial [Deinococcales bacterium]|nr:ADP-ribosylglycohydrolase family protein [Deinococcales bacterium]